MCFYMYNFEEIKKITCNKFFTTIQKNYYLLFISYLVTIKLITSDIHVKP